MGTKIRVFIASTMKDLANERDAVVSRVRSFNFEPVHAEAWLPGDALIWERIEKEIESCHLFVLISGDTYGWVPDKGPGAERGLSVTHMEVNKARGVEGLPILPFFKRLGYESPRDERRDALRQEVASWAAGGVVAQFELAKDLAEKVTASLVEVLSDSYLSTAVKKRAESVRELEPEPETGGSVPEVVDIPWELTDLVSEKNEKKIVLLAGAGISMSAGYPSARAMTETVTAHLGRKLGDPTLNLTGMPFQEIAGNIEAAFGRDELLKIFLRAMRGPQGIKPTEAHLISVRLFDKIVTSNFDTLFEDACDAQGISYIVPNDPPHPQPDRNNIYKLSGSLNRPKSLLITEWDVRNALKDGRPFGMPLSALLEVVLNLLKSMHVLIVGSSLRDEVIKLLISEAAGEMRGFIVSPHMNKFERLQYERLNLQPIEAAADLFFRRLEAEVS